MIRSRKAPWILAFVLGLAVACKSPEQSVKGQIKIDPELSEKVSPHAVLYLIARSTQDPLGPPVAVKRFTQPFHFPIEFTLTPRDAMIPNTAFPAELSVKARISQSGSATPVNPGDIEGIGNKDPIPLGSTQIELILNDLKD